MDEGLEGRVLTVLRATAERRVLPHFASIDEIDAVQLARASERYRIARFEDLPGSLDAVSFVATDNRTWTIHIHERIFDYIAFGLPANPLQAFNPATDEAARVMALVEFILRHEFDHIVRPGRPVREIIADDCRFVVERRDNEPAYYEKLMEAFGDSTNGLRAENYISLITRFDTGEGFENAAEETASTHIPILCALPPDLLGGAFMSLARPDKDLLITTCYGHVSDRSLTVARRARFLDSVVALFDRQRRADENELRGLFEAFIATHEPARVLRDLELDVSDLELEDDDAVYEAFLSYLERRSTPASETTPTETRLAPALEGPHADGEWPQPGTLKERIEATRLDPRVPESVKRAIDNNVSNIGSHSSAKYTEFIETLLAIPWGTVRPIEVGPREFAAGLDAGHFGLAAPKELIADFFANLIWRYRDFDPDRSADWHRTGSAFLFVGPPGVGKTSLAISIARNLGLPYHKISLGGMRDESVLRGHGFTYEGSKPGAIVQGLIKMETTNGLFILDEADKTEPMTVATLLEILDPEQNHLFHDKYTLSTVDIDLSNCHFILTANTLDTVPAPVIDRCQVVHLDRYSVEEKIGIASRFILPRLRERHEIGDDLIGFEPGHEEEHLRYLIRAYTHEAGVRQLELALRKLLLRLQRRHLLEGGDESVQITHRVIKETLESPSPPATINSEDRIGEMLAVGVNPELGIGSVIPVQATRIGGVTGSEGSAVSMVHATGNIEKVMDESRRVATTAILHCAEALDFDPQAVDVPVHLHFLGASTKKDGPSAGAAIALTLASLLSGAALRRDVAATGEIDTQGRITGVGGIDAKIETAVNAGCKTVIVPADNLTGPGGIDRLPEALRRELQILTFEQWSGDHEAFSPSKHVVQVVAVDHIVEAFDVARMDEGEIAAAESQVVDHARSIEDLRLPAHPCPPTVMLKGPEDLDEATMIEGLCSNCDGCSLLVPIGRAEEVTNRIAESPNPARVVEFEPGPQALASALPKITSADHAGGRPAVVVAPFFALEEIDRDTLGLPPSTLVVANNYLRQGIKVSGVKALFHRAICRLLRFEPSALNSFPLLTLQDGVYLLDLDLVPENYRLDPGRCEEILERFITAWLQVVDGDSAAGH
jgi:ATP-dependent Lon protease